MKLQTNYARMRAMMYDRSKHQIANDYWIYFEAKPWNLWWKGGAFYYVIRHSADLSSQERLKDAIKTVAEKPNATWKLHERISESNWRDNFHRVYEFRFRKKKDATLFMLKYW